MGLSVVRDRRILLAHSYYLRYDPKQVARMKPYPPLATLLAASVLRDRGMDVTLFDAMLADGVGEFVAALDAHTSSVVAIIEDNFNFLTKMCTVRMREAACEMIRAAKARGCRVMVNGSDATDRPAVYLAAGADAVIVGEVEDTCAEVAEAWLARPAAPLETIRGLILPGAASGNGAGHRPRRTPARPFRDDLDALPLPAWDLVDAERYRAAWRAAHGRFSWNAVTSRGCPYRCNWCAKPVFGTRYAQRSPDDVAEELGQLKRTVAPDHVWFADDIFGITPGWITEFAGAVAARDARIPFMMQSRANLLKPACVEALAAAGAEEVWLGVESGSQRILDAMDKGTRVAQIREATRALRGAGIRSGWFLQLGYPGEDWRDILLTRDLVRDERPDEIGVSVAYPLPGTRFYDMVRDQLGSKQNWDDSDDLAMMFRGTYTTPFYRDVRDVLHAEVDARTGGPAALDGCDARWDALAAREAACRSDRAPVSVS
jgi:anaerobic magnesium-protoporphyrin IX monomethyl ester cyclase